MAAAACSSPSSFLSGHGHHYRPLPQTRSFHAPPPRRRSPPLQLTAAAVLASGAAVALAAAAPAHAALLPALSEPANALSLPTWAVHVSSVVEWIAAMALVWEYGDKSGFHAWRGLSWGMVPLLGGAMCACTWHFFYNSESLEVLVAIQAALTVIGNMTMAAAAFRIYRAAQEASKSY